MATFNHCKEIRIIMIMLQSIRTRDMTSKVSNLLQNYTPVACLKENIHTQTSTEM